MVKEFDWALWAKNYPVKVDREPGDAVMPEGISITRAGQTVFLTMEELTEALKGTTDTAMQEHKHILEPYGIDKYRCTVCGGNTFTRYDYLKEHKNEH